MASLLAGAVADKLAASDLKLGDVQATLVTPNGQRQAAGGGIGNVVRDQRFSDVTPEVIERARGKSDELGLRSPAISLIKGLQPALRITAKTGTPRVTARNMIGDQAGFVTRLLGVAPYMYEGVFVRVEDVDGRPVAISAFASRAGGSLVWVRPDLGVEVDRGFPPPADR